MLLQTLRGPLRKTLGSNATDTSFPSRIPTATQPTLAIGSTDGQVQENGVLLIPYAVAADTDTFSMRLIGWRPTPGSNTANEQLWIPTVLGEFACTCSTPVGVSGGYLAATDRLCDTITLVGTTANANVNVTIISPANDTIAYILVDLMGCTLFETTFDSTSAGTATGMNCLFTLL